MQQLTNSKGTSRGVFFGLLPNSLNVCPSGRPEKKLKFVLHREKQKDYKVKKEIVFWPWCVCVNKVTYYIPRFGSEKISKNIGSRNWISFQYFFGRDRQCNLITFLLLLLFKKSFGLGSNSSWREIGNYRLDTEVKPNILSTLITD